MLDLERGSSYVAERNLNEWNCFYLIYYLFNACENRWNKSCRYFGTNCRNRTYSIAGFMHLYSIIDILIMLPFAVISKHSSLLKRQLLRIRNVNVKYNRNNCVTLTYQILKLFCCEMNFHLIWHPEDKKIIHKKKKST